MQNDYLEKILTARVYDVAIESPLEPAPNLSRRIQNAVLLKREDLQPVFSFKLRGATTKWCSSPPRRSSAGDRGFGRQPCPGCGAFRSAPEVRSHHRDARHHPQIKVEAVQTRGAHVVLHGDSYSDAYVHALALAKERKLAFVHPTMTGGDRRTGHHRHGNPASASGPDSRHFRPCGRGGLIAGIALT